MNSPINSGFGYNHLVSKGWSPGSGIGKGQGGLKEPIQCPIKSYKSTLRAKDEKFSDNGKNPVSVLSELCAKKKWKPPIYTPKHNRDKHEYKFKVNSKLTLFKLIVDFLID